MIKHIVSIILCMPILMLSSCTPGDVCGPQKIIDCSNNCIDESDVNDSLGDGTCDENLNCSEFNYDDDDCDNNETTTTTTAETPSTTTIDEATTTTTTTCTSKEECATTTAPSGDDCEPYVTCSDKPVCTTDDPCTFTCFEMPFHWKETQSHADACEEFDSFHQAEDEAKRITRELPTCDEAPIFDPDRPCRCQPERCLSDCDQIAQHFPEFICDQQIVHSDLSYSTNKWIDN